MNKQILLTLSILFLAVLAVSAVSASELNVTDSYATSLVDDTSDVSVPLENTADSSEISVSSDSNVDNDSSKVSLSSEEVLESEDSNTLSTNSESNDLLSSDDGITYLSASNDNAVSDGIDSSTIDVSKTVAAKDVTKYYRGSTQYSATFLDAQGNPLANADVKITVNGVSYTKKTNANGVASMSIDLKPGTYKVVAVNPVTGFSVTTSFKILSTITASNIKKVYTDGRQFTATFYKKTGKVLANKKVKFKINGKTYKVKTNEKGVASLSLTSLPKGKYSIISYNKDGLTLTNTVKVVKSSTTSLTTSYYTFLKSDTKKIKVKLLNKFGYAPSKGKIITFKINGKTYSAKTNKNGNAKLKLPSLSDGLYTVKYSFAGNSYYKASSASNKVLIISSKDPTFKVKSGTTFVYGANSPFKVALTSGGVPLAKKTVTLTVDGKSYTKTTDDNGIVSLNINLPIGKYKITYTNKAESKINSKTGSTTIEVVEKINSGNGYGYWVFGSDMKSVNLNTLASQGTTDLFLNYYALEKHGQSAVESWIASANKLGMRVHIWMQAFYGADEWINPATDTTICAKKIAEAKKYASIKGVAGVHIDYLRYPGNAYNTPKGTETISNFAKNVAEAVHSINSNLIVSAAVMPETTDNKYYYGQDMSALSTYLDVIIPMIYKGNYNSDTNWIKTTTEWFVKNSKGAKIWSGLQGYVSDDDTSKLSTKTITEDSQAALNGNAAGVIIFRWGVTNFVNFNSLTTKATASSQSVDTSTSSETVATGTSSASSGTTISIKNIIAGANTVKSYYASNGKVPASVTTGGITFTAPEFLYVMAKAIYQLGNSNTADVTVLKGVSAPTSPSGDTIYGEELQKADYLTVAKNVASFIETNNLAPNYASSAVGTIIYDELIDAFARIVSFYGTESIMANYCTITYVGTTTGGSSSSSSSSSSFSITGAGLNEKNTISDLTNFYKSSTNCQVGASTIKSVVNSLTSGLTTAKDKAVAIFNYVRDKISYSFYYDTKYGASGTLSAKQGNCVDQAHLLVAMFRTAGLAARYVHGTCKFNSGSTYGHVWAQVLIDGVWVCADPTSSSNSLGKINNWKTSSYSLNGRYYSLPF